MQTGASNFQKRSKAVVFCRRRHLYQESWRAFPPKLQQHGGHSQTGFKHKRSHYRTDYAQIIVGQASEIITVPAKAEVSHFVRFMCECRHHIIHGRGYKGDYNYEKTISGMHLNAGGDYAYRHLFFPRLTLPTVFPF